MHELTILQSAADERQVRFRNSRRQSLFIRLILVNSLLKNEKDGFFLLGAVETKVSRSSSKARRNAYLEAGFSKMALVNCRTLSATGHLASPSRWTKQEQAVRRV